MCRPRNTESKGLLEEVGRCIQKDGNVGIDDDTKILRMSHMKHDRLMSGIFLIVEKSRGSSNAAIPENVR